MNFCPHCGSKLDSPAARCPLCGAPLQVQPAGQQTPPFPKPKQPSVNGADRPSPSNPGNPQPQKVIHPNPPQGAVRPQNPGHPPIQNRQPSQRPGPNPVPSGVRPNAPGPQTTPPRPTPQQTGNRQMPPSRSSQPTRNGSQVPPPRPGSPYPSDPNPAGKGPLPNFGPQTSSSTSKGQSSTPSPADMKKLFSSLDPKYARFILPAAVCAAALLLIFLIYSVFRTPTIDLKDFTTVTCTGYDGSGRVILSCDNVAFADAIVEKGKCDSGILDSYKRKHSDSKLKSGWKKDALRANVLGSDYQPAYRLKATDLESKQRTFSNGDTIKIEFSYTDTELAAMKKNWHIKLKNTSFTLKLKGYKSVTKVDPDKFCSVIFSGYNTLGRAELSVDLDKLSSETKIKDDGDLSAIASTLRYNVTLHPNNEDETYYTNDESYSITAEFDEFDRDKLIQEYGLSMDFSKVKWTGKVSGLEVLETLDISDLAYYSITGFYPNIKATVERTDHPESYCIKPDQEFDETVEENESFTETIKVDAFMLAADGYCLTSTELTGTAENLATFNVPLTDAPGGIWLPYLQVTEESIRTTFRQNDKIPRKLGVSAINPDSLTMQLCQINRYLNSNASANVIALVYDCTIDTIQENGESGNMTFKVMSPQDCIQKKPNGMLEDVSSYYSGMEANIYLTQEDLDSAKAKIEKNMRDTRYGDSIRITTLYIDESGNRTQQLSGGLLYLSTSDVDPSEVQAFGYPGNVRITSFDERSNAPAAGLQIGDFITMIDQTPIISGEQVYQYTHSSHCPGDTIEITISRSENGSYTSYSYDVVLN